MRAVQNSVLVAGVGPGGADVDRIERALASYDYPEVFFAWQRGPAVRPVMFYARSERYPTWLPSRPDPQDFPVVNAQADAVGRRLLWRVQRDSELERQHSVFDMQVGPVTYQVVSLLSYDRRFPGQLDSVYGFLVDLAWASDRYVQELGEQVARMGSSPGHVFDVHVDQASDAATPAAVQPAGWATRVAAGVL